MIKDKEKTALRVFRQALKTKAYRDFLKKNKVNTERIKTFVDFKFLPPVSKKGYLSKYDLRDTLVEDAPKRAVVFSATSGSTGKPFYFPRDKDIDWQASIVHEVFLKQGGNKPTLVLVCFGMGVWIGGLITYRAFELAGQRGNPVYILTPGINKKEIFNALKDLAPNFSQVILAGYPPFIKDVLDEAEEEEIDLKKFKLRLLFAAEAITEKFRDHVAKKAGIKNVHLDTMNIYGTAELGTMAWETPMTILLRRSDEGSQKFSRGTLAQYNPLFNVFEESEGKLLVTGGSIMPLVRYDLGDKGEVVDEMVYVREREDLAASLYGLKIYPDIIKEVLLEDRLIKALTGRFTMLTKYDQKQNQYLEINLELRGKDVSLSEKNLIEETTVKHMLKKGSEYRELHNHLGQKALPKLVFWPKEHELYFKSGIKQRWVL